MGINSFKQWEGEGLVNGRRSNASVSELKHLSHLSALDIHVPDANLLPTNLFSDKLERYTILIGDCWEYPDFDETCSNMLKLKLTRRNQFDRGIKLLVKRCEHLYLDGMESVNIISHLFDSGAVEQLKNLHVQNNDKVTYVINSISWSYSHNAFPKLESLFLENLVRLESVCYEQLIGNPFQKLKSLTLRNLPKLIGFCSKGKQSMIDTDADAIGLENEFGALPKLFSNEKVLSLLFF
ncbi:disease resistance protein [Pyrus ussuriensis x Pyrus communis]|uniref:Disease resistance protein n=1 Tax=Pyrus ussuriensis x Pyrus communis TaxID=2448454 RepID=A0A5N5GNH3_9ROSA|nr:disease resistance protein [Pyrus ussuriensis x Pyrus communis]